jgi:YkoY family integral membrane protein
MIPQTFQFGDIGIVLFLIVLEGLLSADNVLVLAILVRNLPKHQQRKALLYGLAGAFVFRLAAIVLASTIIGLWWLQAVGAFYLLWLPIKHFVRHSQGKTVQPIKAGFWRTVFVVEVTDIAFAIDSVLAAVAMVPGKDKIWVVYLGAIAGVVILRFAATVFIKLLDRLPHLEHVAYLLVGWVGIKLGMMATHNFCLAQRAAGNQLGWYVSEMPQPVFWSVLLTIATLGTIWSLKHRDEGEGDDTESMGLPVEKVSLGPDPVSTDPSGTR